MREAEGQVKTHLAEVVYSSGCHREAYAFVNAAVDAIMTLHAAQTSRGWRELHRPP